MDIGCLVVRGPDWQWSDQDGGEGCVGTVVQVEDSSPGMVWVQWDCGARANYRAGYEDKKDLRVFDSSAGKLHPNIMCDGCDAHPVRGMCWKCLDCHDYYLCTKCYMADTHEVDHSFGRMDSCGETGVHVGEREGATKIQARGIFIGARVVRGHDWSWGDQDGGPGREGTVVENMTLIPKGNKSNVTIRWDCGRQQNVYRRGHEGKVDLNYTTPETGGFYYKDHLPALHVKVRKTKNGFTTGDKVFVNVSTKKLKELAVGHGEWNKDMEKSMSSIGAVEDFTSSGDAIVEFQGVKWRFNIEAIAKVPKFKEGDKVLVKSDIRQVMRLQKGHGEWIKEMETMLGQTGKVAVIHQNGDVGLSVRGNVWRVSPAILTPLEEADDDSFGDPDDILGTILKAQADMGAELFSDPFNLFGMLHGQRVDLNGGDGKDIIVMAARVGNLPHVLQLLQSHPERINCVDSHGQTALHASCHSGHNDIVKLLLQRGADTNLLDGESFTALHHAAFGDKSGECVKTLANHGVGVNIHNNPKKTTPLYLAVDQGNKKAVTALLKLKDCDVNLQDVDGGTPLLDAIIKGDSATVDALLETGNVNLTLRNKQKRTFLHAAALKGNKRVANILLEKSAESLNEREENGLTPLHLAASKGHYEVVQLLLNQPNCLKDPRTTNHQTPLLLAVHEGHLDITQLLLENGADLNATDENGETPLHLSLVREKLHSTGLGNLLGFGLPRMECKSPSSYVAISRYLLSRGANVHHKNNHGKTPLDLCEGSALESAIRERARDSKPRETTNKTGVKIVNDFTEKPKTGADNKHEDKDKKTTGAKTTDEPALPHGTQAVVSNMPESSSPGEYSLQGATSATSHDAITKCGPQEKEDMQRENTVTCTEDGKADDGEGSESRGTNKKSEDSEEQLERQQGPKNNEDDKKAGADDKSNDGPIDSGESQSQEVLPGKTALDSKEVDKNFVDQQQTESTRDQPETEFTKASKNQLEEDLATTDKPAIEKSSEAPRKESAEDGNGAKKRRMDIDEFVNTLKQVADVLKIAPTVAEERESKASSLEAKAEFLNSKPKLQLRNHLKSMSGYEGGMFKAGKEQENSGNQAGAKSDQNRVGLTTQSSAGEKSCLTCVHAETDVVFKPCGHKIMCRKCSVRVKRCPECKEMVDERVTQDDKLLEDEESLIDKLQSMEKKLYKMQEKIICCVCLERNKNIVFSCGHGACQVCAEKLGACAICKKNIERKIAMY